MIRLTVDTSRFVERLNHIYDDAVNSFDEIQETWADEIDLQHQQKQSEWEDWKKSYKYYRETTGMDRGYVPLQKLSLTRKMLDTYKSGIVNNRATGKIYIPYLWVTNYKGQSVQVGKIHQEGNAERNIPARPFDTKEFIRKAKEIMVSKIRQRTVIIMADILDFCIQKASKCTELKSVNLYDTQGELNIMLIGYLKMYLPKVVSQLKGCDSRYLNIDERDIDISLNLPHPSLSVAVIPLDDRVTAEQRDSRSSTFNFQLELHSTDLDYNCTFWHLVFLKQAVDSLINKFSLTKDFATRVNTKGARYERVRSEDKAYSRKAFYDFSISLTERPKVLQLN